MVPILKKKETMEIKRILVSRTDKIGDLILSIPSFFMVKKMYRREIGRASCRERV